MSIPKWEKISLLAQSFGYEKMFGHRNFLITKKMAQRVAIANSLWVLMDLKKNRPMIVTPEIRDVYGKHKPLEMEYAPRKIKMPGKCCERQRVCGAGVTA